MQRSKMKKNLKKSFLAFGSFDVFLFDNAGFDAFVRKRTLGVTKFEHARVLRWPSREEFSMNDKAFHIWP